MLRKLLLLIALLVLIAAVLVATGMVNLRRGGDGTMTIETRDLEVGKTTRNVQVPVLKMETREVEVPSVAVEGNQVNGQ